MLLALAGGCGGDDSGSGGRSRSGDRVIERARAEVRAQLSSSAGYAGPQDGPPAQQAGLVAFIAADVTNGGIAAVETGVEEATRSIGWRLRVLDGRASVEGRRRAMSEAIRLKADGVILGGFDATEQMSGVERLAGEGIPVVGWHAGPRPGADARNHMFANVTTDPRRVARLAARYAIAKSRGRAGAVIFTDSNYEIAVDKAKAIRAELERCRRCEVFGLEDVPIAKSQERMPSLVSSLLQRYGSRLTYLLAINGNYFAGSRAALVDAGRKGTDPPFGVAAGDGDASEFERIRSGDYQAASVAEPLYLQGWQLVDELNRALAGEPNSGYVAPPQLITRANVPTGSVFDPSASYRANYRRIWERR